MTDWKPIDKDTPRDGRFVLLWQNDAYWVARYADVPSDDRGRDAWTDAADDIVEFDDELTGYWHPLPSPPEPPEPDQ